MRALVTGAPGWLGNRLLEVVARGFEGQGPEVDWRLRCLVLPGVDPSFVRALGHEVVGGDVTRPDTLAEAVRGCDVVLHLAGIVHPRHASEFEALNTQGTRNVLEAAAAAGVRRLVLVSTDAVAGVRAPGSPLLREEDPPHPHGGYGRSKYRAEELARAFHAQRRIETVVLRPFWFYGPHQPERQTRFYRMIRAGRPFLFGDGRNQRSLAATDNVVDALLRAATVPAAAGRTYWIGDARTYTTLEIYDTLAEELGAPRPRPRRLPGLLSASCRAADAVLQSVGIFNSEIHVAGKMDRDIAGSIERARAELGYEPRLDLREGTRRAIAWCRAHGRL